MRGRMAVLIASAAIYMLCLNLPIIVVEQITGLWDILERAMNDYISFAASNPTNAAIYEWFQSYPYQGTFSIATYIFLLLVPGPLTLGLSVIFLRALRGQPVFADMVFSGFGNFFRAMMTNFIRIVFIALWSILLLVPGVIAYYRYSFVFFLLADNPTMSPFTAFALSKYYMKQNKGSRFLLDLSLIGWLFLSAIALGLLSDAVTAMLVAGGYATTLFSSELVSGILGAIVMAPLCVYRGIAGAEYYHRVICRDPRSFEDPLMLPETSHPVSKK